MVLQGIFWCFHQSLKDVLLQLLPLRQCQCHQQFCTIACFLYGKCQSIQFGVKFIFSFRNCVFKNAMLVEADKKSFESLDFGVDEFKLFSCFRVLLFDFFVSFPFQGSSFLARMRAGVGSNPSVIFPFSNHIL